MKMDPSTADTAAKVAVGAAGSTGLMGWFFRYMFKRMNTRIDEAYNLAISAATMEQVKEEIDRAMIRPHDQLREDFKALSSEMHAEMKEMRREVRSLYNRG